jgi:hypothetical protein
MTLARYYSHLLRKNDESAPTLEEAQRDFQRVIELNTAAFGYYN